MLTPLQRHLYRALLLKDLAAFETQQKKGLNNMLVQLRKCVNHPYLFDGVEPEPFHAGEHLVHASGKLIVLDRLLGLLRTRGARVLIFSQMTRMLDILQGSLVAWGRGTSEAIDVALPPPPRPVRLLTGAATSRPACADRTRRCAHRAPDYLQMRRYRYERLDGSVRGEERNLAVQNFVSDSTTFVFLLSTRAGGVGLNLTASDTVIFMDSDYNPQVGRNVERARTRRADDPGADISRERGRRAMELGRAVLAALAVSALPHAQADLQAAARVHRIGQTKPVTIIRLLCRDTVEDVIMRRAAHKLRLSQAVMAATDAPGASSDRTEPTVQELISALKVRVPCRATAGLLGRRADAGR